MSRQQHAPHDFGRALQSAVVNNANPRLIRKKGAKIYANGWWRDGGHPNVVFNIEEGNWCDLKTGEHGGVKEFARTVFGMTLPVFMDRFGCCDSRPINTETPKPQRTDMADLWEQLSCANAALPSRWLATARGFPVNCASLIDSGFACVNRQSISVWPADLQRWVRARIFENGTHIAIPLRDAITGMVVNIHLRPLKDVDGKRFVPGCSLFCHETKSPRAYGFAGAAQRAELLIITEGAVDAMTAEGFCRHLPSVVVVGCPSATMMPRWSDFLCQPGRPRPRRTIIVPHLDPPSGDPRFPGRAGQRAAAKLLAHLQLASIPGEMFEWDIFRMFTSTAANDVNEATCAAGWQRSKTAFLTAIGAI